VINSSGAWQTLTLSVARGHSAKVAVRIKNVGGSTDSYSVVGQQTGSGASVAYYSAGKNVTRAVRRGLQSTGNVAPGRHRDYSAVVTMPRSARVGAIRTVKVFAVSYRSPRDNGVTVRDVVAIKIKAR
jgi:hypothetical protein